MSAGQKLSVEMTSKLLEVTPEKVTVEVTTEATTGQMKTPTRVKKQEAPAKLTRPANATPIKEGTENIVVAGKSYSCHVAEETREGIQIKTWTSDKVPG